MAEQKLFIKGAHHPTLHKLFCCSFIFYYAPFCPHSAQTTLGQKDTRFMDTKIDESKFLVAQNINIYILYTQDQPIYRRHEKI